MSRLELAEQRLPGPDELMILSFESLAEWRPGRFGSERGFELRNFSSMPTWSDIMRLCRDSSQASSKRQYNSLGRCFNCHQKRECLPD